MKIAIVGSGNGAVTAAVDMVNHDMKSNYIVEIHQFTNLIER